MNYLYKHLVQAAPIGYAYYKIINNSEGFLITEIQKDSAAIADDFRLVFHK